MFRTLSSSITTSLVISALVLTANVSTVLAKVCVWEGKAPICNGKCRPGYTRITGSKRGDGKKCLSGKKAYCCKTSELIIRGTAPFCNGKCKKNEEMLGKSNRGPKGKKCITGKAAICRVSMDKDTPSNTSNPSPTVDMSQADTFINPKGFTVNRHYDEHKNGAKINLWKQNHHPSQNWVWSSETIRSVTNANYCLNIHNYDLRNGAVINLWSCNGHDSQNWTRVGNTIRPARNHSYCLNLHKYDNKNGATINLWRCNGHHSQNWK